jgi:ribonuclease HII
MKSKIKKARSTDDGHFTELELEDLVHQKHYGVDEAGRGCLNGPVVVVSVQLNDSCPIKFDDSKQLSSSQRDKLYDDVFKYATDVTVVFVEPIEIDEKNILNATLSGMFRSWENSKRLSRLILVDGNKTPKETSEGEFICIVKGDALVSAISAASIVAKVTRDRFMKKLSLQYPSMEYEQHKGYPTARHVELLHKYGVNETYRHSFKPVRDALGLGQQSLF